jgi:hypothetical protein
VYGSLNEVALLPKVGWGGDEDTHCGCCEGHTATLLVAADNEAYPYLLVIIEAEVLLVVAEREGDALFDGVDWIST